MHAEALSRSREGRVGHYGAVQSGSGGGGVDERRDALGSTRILSADSKFGRVVECGAEVWSGGNVVVVGRWVGDGGGGGRAVKLIRVVTVGYQRGWAVLRAVRSL